MTHPSPARDCGEQTGGSLLLPGGEPPDGEKGIPREHTILSCLTCRMDHGRDDSGQRERDALNLSRRTMRARLVGGILVMGSSLATTSAWADDSSKVHGAG